MRWDVPGWAVAVAATILVGVLLGCTTTGATTLTGEQLSNPPSPLAEPVTSPREAAVASGSPGATSEAPGTVAPASAGVSPVPGSRQPRAIELELTSDLRIVQRGQPVTDIAVTPGETIRFVITNTAGFDHDFYIGPDDRLAAGRVQDLPGLDTWSSADPRRFDWTVPEDAVDLKFGCILRGHYPRMSGTFSILE